MKYKSFEIYMDFTKDSCLIEVSIETFGTNDWCINYLYDLENARYIETLELSDRERKLLEAKIDEHLNKDDVLSELNFNN